MTDDLSQKHRRKLELSIMAAIAVVALDLVRWFIWSYPFLVLPLALVLFGVAFFGAVCGLGVLFSLRGFPRLVAALSSSVCCYAVVRCVVFTRWAIGLP